MPDEPVDEPFDPDAAVPHAGSPARGPASHAAAPCPACGYDLIGHLSATGGAERRCPECGARFTWQPALAARRADAESPERVQVETASPTRRRLRAIETWILIVILVGVMVVPVAGWLIMVALSGP